jgi:hypothetical protein
MTRPQHSLRRHLAPALGRHPRSGSLPGQGRRRARRPRKIPSQWPRRSLTT